MFDKIKTYYNRFVNKPPVTIQEKIKYLIKNIYNLKIYDSGLTSTYIDVYVENIMDYNKLLKTIIEFPINKEYIVLPKIYNKKTMLYMYWFTNDKRMLPNPENELLEFLLYVEKLVEIYDTAVNSPLIPFLYGNSTKILQYKNDCVNIVEDIFSKTTFKQ